MFLRYETIAGKQLVGMRINMSFLEQRTAELWRAFMSRRHEIKNAISSDLISMQVYCAAAGPACVAGIPDFKNFKPDQRFDKWAAVEVGGEMELVQGQELGQVLEREQEERQRNRSSRKAIPVPHGMEYFMISAGTYAVFLYRGRPQNSGPFFQEIFLNWLPNSGYELDSRPHFEVLGTKYKNASDD